MKQRIHIYFLLAWLGIFACIHSFAQTNNPLVRGKISIKVDENTFNALNAKRMHKNLSGNTVTAVAAFNKVNNEYKVNNWERVFPESPMYEARHRKHGLHRWYQISFDPNTPVDDVLKSFKAVAGVTSVEPVYEKELIPYKTTPYSGNEKRLNDAPYNDPMLAAQWHYNNTGQTGGTAGCDIRLFDAWKTTSGKPGVIVSIHDQGIDLKHQDISANLWINKSELNGKAGVDDDNNGFIDDINGFNFRSNSGKIDAEEHGTHVAGTVAAVNNNGIGVCGVAGGSGNGDGARLMSCEILGGANTARSYVYAADNGAVISQNSWGYVREGVYEESVYDAIKYFVAEAGNYEGSPMKGGVVIFAAGNNNDDGMYYPAAWEEVIAVSAIDPFDKKTTYSNFDTWVDIAAPGGENTYGYKSSVLSTVPNNKYAYMDGTSMACPHVSGVAALSLSVNGGPGYTNEMLKLTLLTSFRNIDKQNPGYLGQLGIGAVDAVLATKKNLGIAPEQISDLKVNGVSQDFATITWSCPNDKDDGITESYRIYYNDAPITAENLANAISEKLVIRQTPGTVMNYEIKNLKSLTTYYFAIVAFDRWNNQSVLSNVVITTTNAGPKLVFGKPELTFSIFGNDVFNFTEIMPFKNEADGILRWKAEPRSVNFQAAWSTKKVNYPAAKSGYEPIGNIKMGKLPLANNIRENIFKVFTPFYITYIDENASLFMVGDQDTSVTNSSAQKFVIDREEGFNLTHVSMYIGHKNITGPIVLEIYKNDITTDNLVYLQELTSYSGDYYEHFIKLDHQLFFNYGEQFWVVFHIPSGNVFPLGCGTEIKEEYSDYAKISLNVGKTWIPLEQALGDNRFTWSTTAHSFNKYLGEYITLQPAAGEIAGNTTADVDVVVDASKLINGTYQSYVVVKSNETNQPLSRFPVNIEISGKKPKLYSRQVIDFDNVFIGSSKTLKVQMRNIGYGNMKGLSASVNNPEFTIAKDLPYVVSAQEDMWVYLKYTPATVGNTNAILTITDQDGYSYNVNLAGVAALPSQITLEPASQTFDNLAVGETRTGKFKIKNTGNYPLQYFMPSQTDNSGVMEYNNRIHKFGYIGYKTYDNVNYHDISQTGVKLTEYFYDVRNYFFPLEIGFNFPYFNTVKNKIYISNYGVLAFNNNSTFNQMPADLESPYTPDGMISASHILYNLKSGGNIYYKKESDKLIVQYSVYDEWNLYATIDFQIVLHYNGDIEYIYKDFGTLDDWALSWYFAGIENDTKTDGLVLSDMFNKNYTTDTPWKFVFKYPGHNTLKNVTNTKGTIAPGSEVDVEYTFSTESLMVDNYFNSIGIISNDPAQPIKQFTFNVNVVSGGSPDFKLSTNKIDFGSVYQNDVKKLSFNALNTGKKAISIASVISDNDLITLNGPVSYKHNVGLQQNYDVTVNTQTIGDINGKIIFTDIDGKLYELAVTAKIIAAPAVSVNVDKIEKTLDAGTQNTENEITVTNTGLHPLTYTISAFDWLKLKAKNTSSVANDTVSYVWKSNINEQVTEQDPNYNWIDISTTGKKYYEEFQNEYAVSIPVSLPFDFNFYGNTYNKVWLSEMGIIGMEYIDSYQIIGQFFPNIETPNALIAPAMGCMIASTTATDKRMAVYVQEYTDYVVIQYNNMKDRFGASVKTDIQVILYKSGEIKFQYRFGGQTIVPEFSTIGIENQSGTDGCLVSGYQSYILNKSAVCFTPVIKRVLQPGKSDTYSVMLDALKLEKGEYASNITIKSDAPGMREVNVPVNLIINGTNKMEVKGDFNFGTQEAYQIETDNGPEFVSYTKDIVISNTGHDVLTLSRLNLSNTIEVELQKPVTRRMTDDVDWYFVTPRDFFTLLPGESQMFRVVLTPTGENANIISAFRFVTNTDQVNFEIPITATIVKPAVIDVDSKNIEVSSNTLTDKQTKNLVVSNKGASALNYNVSIKYNRTGETTKTYEQSKSVFSTHALSAPLKKSSTNNTVVAANYGTYNRTMQYDNATAPASFLGFGAEVNMISLTGFTAPENGFSLSHVSTWYRWDAVTESKVTVDILTGESTGNLKVVYTKDYLVKRENNDKGELITIDLDTAIQFLSNERFWVAFTYPLGVPYPQGTVTLDNSVKSTFYYLGNDGWGDLSMVGAYAKSGWMVRAHEAQFKESGWLTITPTTGNIATNTNAALQLNFNASGAVRGINKAVVNLLSNDPVNPLKAVNVTLKVNEAPVFKNHPVTKLTVNENEKLSFEVIVNDPELNKFELTTVLMNGLTITKATDKFVIDYTPGYSDAGLKKIVLKATDEYLAENTLNIAVEVINKNRAPVAKAVAAKTLYTNNEPLRIKATDIFSDPDGDTMIYGAKANNKSLEIATSEDGYVITPLSNGKTTITLSATDVNNAVTTVDLNVNVVENHAPVAVKIEDQFIVMNGQLSKAVVNLTTGFSDVDKDALTYTVEVADTLIAKANSKATNLEIIPVIPGNTMITVTANDGKGGVAQTTFMVTVTGATTAPEGKKIVADEIFSPNGDGINDYWTIDVPQSYEKCTFYIYNSTGEQVFTSYGYANQWNGMDNGNKLPIGTYYYIVKFPDGSVVTGTIALVR